MELKEQKTKITMPLSDEEEKKAFRWPVCQRISRVAEFNCEGVRNVYIV